jgi:hypothetical protein
VPSFRTRGCRLIFDSCRAAVTGSENDGRAAEPVTAERGTASAKHYAIRMTLYSGSSRCGSTSVSFDDASFSN